MDVGTIERVVNEVGAQVTQTIDALQPVGSNVTNSLGALSLMFFGFSVLQGWNAMVPAAFRVTMYAGLTSWAVANWATVLLGTLEAGRQIIALIIPGYSGPTHLLELAMTAAGRIEVEQVGFSLATPVTSGISVVMAAIAPIFIFVGLAVLGLMAALSEILLLLGGTLGPIVLPFIVFSETAHLGWGMPRFLLIMLGRIVMVGVANHVMVGAIDAVVSMPGGTDAMRHEDIYALLGLSLLCFLVALSINGIGRDAVGGGGSSMGIAGVGMAGSAGAAMAAGMSNTIGAGAAAARSMGSAGSRMIRQARGGMGGGGGAGAQVGRARESAFN